MASVEKLNKRLRLPFSGTQLGLAGFTARVFDYRTSSAASASSPSNVKVTPPPPHRVGAQAGAQVGAQAGADADVVAAPTTKASGGGLFALELISETHKLPPRLNKQLIPILEEAAGPKGSDERKRLGALLQRYAERQAEQVLQLGKPNLDREQQLAATLRLAHASSSRTSHFGLGTPSLADMVDAGVEVLHEPFLLDRCQKSIDDTLRKIRTGKLLVGDASVVVKGMPDFTGDLAEGEIMLIIDGKHSQPLALRGIDNDTASGGGGQRGASTSTPALVYRPPGVRASDVRKVKSVYSQRLVDELFGDANAIDSSRASAVFFSIHGAQPLGDMLAGGDYDGDEYYIFQERELIDLFEGGAVAAGQAEVNHEAAADRLGLRHPVTVELGEMYLDLLDGAGDSGFQTERLKPIAPASGDDDWDAFDPEFQDQYSELVASIREHELLAPYEGERRASPLAEPPRLLAEACAIYEVVYSEAQAKAAAMEHVDPRYYTAFAWHMCGDLLLYVRKARLSRNRDPSRALFSGLVR
ncbi:RNA-dependent RNA polymerase [Chrysochromulina tobinii]|uniref:RNA-dependent RNA polymerase n=1 Tax=Chrysochromulina tobinii TaxID=1460289 RepID=A0A0M0JS92_9EUKA|nr:RNA-dependent RNA polymerase [Chrysochromulina tobinii]|eukprot:KOO29083.1 RNA-dependent RNA polymerase [Chrysochromulina sp. CCMP291]